VRAVHALRAVDELEQGQAWIAVTSESAQSWRIMRR